MIAKIRNSFFTKTVTMLLISQMLLPVQALAVTGGPAQPEFTSFTPVGVSDMVDLFTGDFQYNIPLLDVEGYPINLSYSSGIGMEDQASCVGLGWTLNAAGAINRTVRGLPDDFNGEDKVTTSTHYNPNWTLGVNFSIGDPEIIGKEIPVSLGMGIFYNNYSGPGYEANIRASMSSGGKLKMGGSLNLGLSSEGGLSISPSVGLDAKIEKGKADEGSGMFGGSLNLGGTYNSRSGLRQVTIGASAFGSYQSFNKATQEKKTMFSDKKEGSAAIPMGLMTYVPQNTQPMNSASVSGNIGFGGEGFWLNMKGKVSGYFNRQYLASPRNVSPAYGYLYSGLGAQNEYAMHDFNREKDGAYNEYVPALAMTQMTYDVYTATGQGVSGMFRPYRDFGTVYDPFTFSSSNGGAIGGDLGVGGYVKGGLNFSYDYALSTSGKWTGGDNVIMQNLSFRKHDDRLSAYEPVYFKNAGDFSTINESYFDQIGGFDPVRIELERRHGNRSTQESSTQIPSNKRTNRERRNQSMSYLTAAEASGGGALELEMTDYPRYEAASNGKIDRNNNTLPRTGSGRNGHHISEITVTKPDGSRYVYGSQTYNYVQHEVTFNVSNDDAGKDKVKGLVVYNPGVDNSVDNPYGIDRYYSCNQLPPHATAYQLTAVLSADYVDVEGNGPSPNDLGNYTKFNYTRLYGIDEDDESLKPYKWRNPYALNTANLQEGQRYNRYDDKGTYIYGIKEIKELHSIETKNYVAEFYYSPRKDAYDVSGENGKQGENTLNQLDSIKLYNRRERQETDRETKPIKTVHFDYDYTLCEGIPSYKGDGADGRGKLTLKKVWFTYGDSQKGYLSPYVFNYDGHNPGYNEREQDRWGVYKPNETGTQKPTNIDAPYTIQNTETDRYAGAWNLTSIRLPSGGTINVEYESDDYSYIQDRRAGNMIQIAGFHHQANATRNDLINRNKLYTAEPFRITSNDYIYFEAPAANFDDFMERYLGDNNSLVKELFFRCYIDLDGKNNWDYVMGYISLEPYFENTRFGRGRGSAPSSDPKFGWNDGLAWIKLPSMKMDDNRSGNINPIAKTAMQHVLVSASDLYYGGNSGGYKDEGPTAAIFDKMAGTINDLVGMMKGRYHNMANQDYGRNVRLERSFLRLNASAKRPGTPETGIGADYLKFGGGSRVKKLAISDNWGKFISGNEDDDRNFSYGQTYEYTLTTEHALDGIPKGTKISSGVAAYEPFVGNEENPFRQPNVYIERHDMAPDNRFYQERPYGEMFFPSPSVGYSRVVVKNLQYEDARQSATGYTEHEFYTAKDFPVLVKEPDKGASRDEPVRDKSNWLAQLLKINIKDYLTASQSYAIELNDMHGKAKGQRVYQEGKPEAISSVQYYYRQENSNRLSNKIKAIDENGQVRELLAGVDIEMVIDERENTSYTGGGSIDGNLDASPVVFGIPLPIPTVWPGLYSEETRFRAITATKVITRYGILEKTVAQDLGSYVTTTNLGWDAETGEVLLTRTENGFDDPVYSFTYPAHWGYKGMAPAYKNTGLRAGSFNPDAVAAPQSYFWPGDELYLKKSGQLNGIMGWVTRVDQSAGRIEVVERDGKPVAGTFENLTIVRSGRRNQQSTPIGTVTTLHGDPVQTGAVNFEGLDILNAGAVEFNPTWAENLCEYETAGNPDYPPNPYITGEEGNYRPKRSYVFLTGRTRSNTNRNTNIRQDGVFDTFSPFWKKPDGNRLWTMDKQGWTFASEVTMFSPYGFELENRDALDRYTAATYGYNNTLPTAVAANTRYRELGFTNFEDNGMNAAEHFGFDREEYRVGYFTNEQSHSGRYSIEVKNGEKVWIEKVIKECTSEQQKVE